MERFSYIISGGILKGTGIVYMIAGTVSVILESFTLSSFTLNMLGLILGVLVYAYGEKVSKYQEVINERT